MSDLLLVLIAIALFVVASVMAGAAMFYNEPGRIPDDLSAEELDQ